MDNRELAFPLWMRWATFVKERFEPISSLMMIILFFTAHLFVFPSFSLPGELKAWLELLAIVFGVVFFFFKLRLYDEIKDYELDVVINPTRPLPRKLLLHRHLYAAIILMILLELALFAYCGLEAFVSLSLAVAYSLLMYREFFIPKYIRPHLTTYAMSHTIVTVLLGGAIFAALLGTYSWKLPGFLLWFVLNNWFMFNIFEFGRKTFAGSEEREGVESYSKIFTRLGAVGLVLSQALLSNFSLWKMGILDSKVLFFSYLTTLLIGGVGLIFVMINTPRWGKIYRIYSSLHIVLFYSGFIILRLI